MADTPARAWRAPCPHCGAPVDFRSAASASAVCSYCRSTLVREGQALRRIGQSAELFDDHSPLQRGATGRYLGEAFTLAGRLQLQTAQGRWNEWHALFDAGRSGWLSEDNGAYVFAFDVDAAVAGALPAPGSLQAGARALVAGQAWDVASVQRATLHAAEGELPQPPKGGATFTVADLRNAQGEVGTLDDRDPAGVQWSVGRAVRLADLQLHGLREGEAVRQVVGRSLACPSCGAALEPRLESTQSIVCGQCQAVVDLSGGAFDGVGADLHHYAQTTGARAGMEPQLPLGATGRLALGSDEPLPWQVVGYQERCDLPAPGSDDEQTFWREYLLYHRTEGFAFLVDAEDGWSWVRPLTGAPQLTRGGATWQGVRYRERWRYQAQVTYVLGEFYWRVQRDERAHVTDYVGEGAHAEARLSREQTAAVGATAGSEVVWSAGRTLAATTVADAFGILPSQRAALQRDAAPTAFVAASAGWSLQKVLILVVLLLIVLALLGMCSSDDECDRIAQTFGAQSAEYQQCQRQRGTGVRSGSWGGSWGGYSSGGGGHK